MSRIYHCFRIAAPIEKVGAAISERAGLTKWWTKNVEGVCAVGNDLTFRFSSGAFNRMKIKVLRPDRVEWECVDGHEEWIGTHVLFELRVEDEGVKVCFCHDGWREQTEYMGECSFHWAFYLRSLQQYCETGRGTPDEGSVNG